MSLNLLSGYGSSDSEDDGVEQASSSKPLEAEDSPAPVTNKTATKLPSALDLLSGNSSGASIWKAKPVNNEPEVPIVTKKCEKDKSEDTTRKRKADNTLVPPQLARPNINTEDYKAWTDKKTAEKTKKKEALSYNQREKRKRDSGQTSRGKSFVEEEKRILRQHGV